ncbi:hypothetical protein JXB12_02390 [candidate division KSB1 bacterium]|nr:hypothetical protein [candidate division KSB1 bacterium]
MADYEKTYHRKISDEEAQGQYIMILKSDLNFFPKIGKEFKLLVKGTEEKTFETTILAIPCWCMGPNKPHEHYRIDAKPFRDIFPIHFSKKIKIKKESESEYTLE